MAELGDFLVSGDTTVNIDVEMLDYGFIGKCEDAKTLRGIIDTLKSGKEGIYPELCQAAEDRLFAIIPEKERKRIMRLKHQTTPDQVHDAEQDLQSWQSEVFQVDKELLKSSDATRPAKRLPPVRGQKVEKLDVPSTSSKETKTADSMISHSTKTERLSGYDFHAWEKFNVDEALAAIDEEDIEVEKEVMQTRLKKKKIAEEAARKRVERHEKSLEILRTEMNISNMSTVQRKNRAAREKQKGNESFRSGENDEAYVYYSRSLALDDSVAAVYSNRALVCLRTGKLETAEDDCSRALFLEPEFTKARSRRGIARLKAGKYEHAILDFECALESDSANKELMSLLQKAKDKYLEVEGKEYISKKEKERRDAAMQMAIASGLPVKVASSSSAEALILPVTSTDFELLRNGVCEVFSDPSERLTRIVIEDDSDSSVEGEDDSNAEVFTRIQIDEGSDSEEDEDNEEVNEDAGFEQKDINGAQSTPEAPDGFFRIAITDDSDSDSDSDIIDGSAERDRIASDIEAKKQMAENLKVQANESMQGGDLPKAIRLYTECIAIDASSPVGIAAYGNRSLANLKLKNFINVLEDTNFVLSHDPSNLKALYRRALANEATNNLESAIKDVDNIIRIQPNNVLALEARDRFMITQKATSVPQSSPNSQPCTETSVSSDDGNLIVSNIDESLELKNLGNDAMKAGRTADAIDFYTRAISCDPSNNLFFNNRAQAYIKTSQFQLAEADASHVIQYNTEDIPSLKAYYRRALARKGLNTVESLKGADEDVSFILTQEPDNKAAIMEKQKISNILKKLSVSQQKTEVIMTKDTMRNSDDSSGLIEVSSKVTKRSERVEEPSKIVPKKEPISADTGVQKVVSQAVSKTKAAKDISVKNPTVPKNPPKTVYEFERIWRGLKNRPDLFASYLKCFKKSTFKKVLKDTCSPDLLSSMLVSVRDHLLASEGEDDVEKGISVLEGLAGIPKYDMVRSLLPSPDLECMKSCLDYVSVKVSTAKADSLREKLDV